MNATVSSVPHGGTGSGCCRFCDPQGAKAIWIEWMMAKREGSYSKREQREFRAYLEAKYADAPDSAFEGRLARQKKETR